MSNKGRPPYMKGKHLTSSNIAQNYSHATKNSTSKSFINNRVSIGNAPTSSTGPSPGSSYVSKNTLGSSSKNGRK